MKFFSSGYSVTAIFSSLEYSSPHSLWHMWLFGINQSTGCLTSTMVNHWWPTRAETCSYQL